MTMTERDVRIWNQTHPVGAFVYVEIARGLGVMLRTCVERPAWMTPGGVPIVYVENVRGPVELHRVHTYIPEPA